MTDRKVTRKTKAAHKPPARVRYEQSHPVVSCRLSRDGYDLLKQRLDDLGGVSFADFVEDSLGILQLRVPETKEIKENARRTGYDQGKKEYEIWYYCSVCGKRVNMLPEGDDHRAMMTYMKEKGWRHGQCP